VKKLVKQSSNATKNFKITRTVIIHPHLIIVHRQAAVLRHQIIHPQVLVMIEIQVEAQAVVAHQEAGNASF